MADRIAEIFGHYWYNFGHQWYNFGHFWPVADYKRGMHGSGGTGLKPVTLANCGLQACDALHRVAHPVGHPWFIFIFAFASDLWSVVRGPLVLFSDIGFGC